MGFLLSGPGLAGIAIAVALALTGVQTYRLNSCQAEAAAHKAQVAILGASLAEQNRAVEALATEGTKKAAASAAALRKAEGKARIWDDQAKRLTAILAGRKATDATDCKAAWEAIRAK